MTRRDKRGDHWTEAMTMIGTSWLQLGTLWANRASPGFTLDVIGFRTYLIHRTQRT